MCERKSDWQIEADLLALATRFPASDGLRHRGSLVAFCIARFDELPTDSAPGNFHFCHGSDLSLEFSDADQQWTNEGGSKIYELSPSVAIVRESKELTNFGQCYTVEGRSRVDFLLLARIDSAISGCFIRLSEVARHLWIELLAPMERRYVRDCLHGT